ncbi:MAG TPA: transglycosylase domain-containing protein [Cryptosporangiaceae bacterium]|nr:transglycosylase domain-containing protein [Cryptosporangiaceae bacterium]
MTWLKWTEDTRAVGNVVSLVVCGVMAGVVVAAAAFPAAGITGLTAKSASDSFRELPNDVKIPPLPQKSQLYASDGKTLIATFFDENRQNVPLTKVAPIMQQAIIAAEDNRFYVHQGVDLQGVVRAFVANQKSGEVQQGASTLTQQYVRQILQYGADTPAKVKAATEDTPARKLREIRYAVALEKKLTKTQIMENYLNVVYFGNSGYGIHSASYAYFSKPPAKLTLAEAALLAGLVKDPVSYNPARKENGTKRALDRRAYTLNQMVKLNFITPAQAQEAKKAPLVLKQRKSTGSCENGNLAYGFYCGWFLDWWKSKDNVAFGKNRQEREDNLKKGGYRIVGSIHPKMQSAAQEAVDNRYSAKNPFALGTVLVEPGTGRVLAMAINRKFSIAKNPGGVKYPNTTNPLLSGTPTSPGYQAGSTFKMFTILAALQQKKPLSHTIHAPPRYSSIFVEACKTKGFDPNRYCPKNASPSMTGRHTMWTAFGESANTYFVQLEEQVTVKKAVEAAEQVGVEFKAPNDIKLKESIQKDPNGAWGSFTLGTAQVSPLDMANSYATVAARGKRCKALPVREIIGQDGKPIAAAKPQCEQVLPPAIADAATDAARCPVGDQSMVGAACTHPGGGRTASSVGGAIDRPVAGKTGTTDENNAAWFVGFTPNLAAASFLVNPDAPNKQVPNTRLPIEVSKSAMNGALQFLPRKNFVAPIALYAHGTKANVPNVDGDSVSSAIATLKGAGFDVRVEGTRVNSTYAAGTVARTDPGGGETTSEGSLVTIFVSNGQPPVASPAAPPGGAQPPGSPRQPGDRRGRPVIRPPVVPPG